MRMNRQRTFTSLGDFQAGASAKHRVRAVASRSLNDPFEGDPFKIQSFNFHYADRPNYPVENPMSRFEAKRSQARRSASKPFETFYYNHDFDSARHDRPDEHSNRFHEFRRRRFLQDSSNTGPIGGSFFPDLRPRGFAESSGYQRYALDSQAGSRASTQASSSSTTQRSSSYAFGGPLTTPTMSPLLQTGSARAFLEACLSSPNHVAVPASNTSNTDIRNNLDLAANSPRKSYSRSSLLVNRPTSSATIAAKRGCSSTTALYDGVGKDASNLRTSSSYHDRKTALEAKPSLMNVSSGCHININIKSSESNPDNLVINIDTNDPANGPSTSKAGRSSSSLMSGSREPCRSANRSSQRVMGSSKNSLQSSSRESSLLDPKPSSSSRTFTVASPRSHSYAHGSISQEQLGTAPKITKSASKDRVPSMVPWRLETKPKAGDRGPIDQRLSNRIFNTQVAPIRDPRNDSGKRHQSGYSSALNDIRNVRRHQGDKHQSSGVGQKLMPERAVFNVILNQDDHRRQKPTVCGGVRRQSSKNEISTHLSKPQSQRCDDNRYTLKRSATFHSPPTSQKPFSVNINVYTDKSKMIKT